MGPNPHLAQGDPVGTCRGRAERIRHVTFASCEVQPLDVRRGGRPGRGGQGGRPGRVRPAGEPDLPRDLLPGLPVDRRRGGCSGRGAGVVPAGLPGSATVPWRRPVLDLALPDHGQLRLDPARSPSRHRHDELDDELAGERLAGPGNPEAAVEAAALRDRLHLALAGLPPRLRAVVVLRDVYDLPHEAIAAELGISVSAAKVRLHRARRRLREDLFARPDELSPTRRTPVRSDPALTCAEVAEPVGRAADGTLSLGARPRAPRRAVPALPGRGGPVPPAAARAPLDADRAARPAPGLLERAARLARRGVGRRAGRSRPYGRRVAYVGGAAAATAAGCGWGHRAGQPHPPPPAAGRLTVEPDDPRAPDVGQGFAIVARWAVSP